MMSLPSPPKMMLPAPNEVTGISRRQRLVEERLQAVDEAGVGEHAAEDAGDSDGGRVGIITLQDVGECRARQAFHLGEPRQDRRARQRHWRLVEGAEVHVDGHAEGIVLEDSPVEPGEALVAVSVAAVADHDVVAEFTIHAVADGVTEEDVVAEDRVPPERVEVVAGAAVGHAELDPVVAFVAEHASRWRDRPG